MPWSFFLSPPLHPLAPLSPRRQYDARRRVSPDPAVKALLERSAAEAGVLAKVFGGKPPK